MCVWGGVECSQSSAGNCFHICTLSCNGCALAHRGHFPAVSSAYWGPIKLPSAQLSNWASLPHRPPSSHGQLLFHGGGGMWRSLVILVARQSEDTVLGTSQLLNFIKVYISSTYYILLYTWLSPTK